MLSYFEKEAEHPIPEWSVFLVPHKTQLAMTPIRSRFITEASPVR